MRKFRLWALVGLIAAVAACTSKPAEAPDSAFASYLSAYTGGVISEGTPVRIELATPIPM